MPAPGTRAIGHSAIALLIAQLTASAASAATIVGDPTENFNLFGKQTNFCSLISPGGVCAAVSAINSFIFLENRHPSVYGTSLTPNVQGAKPNQTDQTDATNFGDMLYSMPGGVPDNTTGFNNYVTAKTNWFDQHSPGTSMITSNYPGSAKHNGVPTLNFLMKEIEDQEDVELFVSGGGIAHAITLTGVSCTSPIDCIIKYQDSNSPGTQQTQALFQTGGPLTFEGLPGTDAAKYARTFFTIDAAFAESPIPEPGPWALVGIGIAALVAGRRRERPVG